MTDKTTNDEKEAARIRMIVAAGRDGAIGRGGDLIWHLPGDLRRFRQLTMGHPLIMGRKTWESLPKKPLPGRRNIVVTRDPEYRADGAETASSPEEAMTMVAGEEAFIMGGAQIYEATLPLVSRIDLTLVEAECEGADAWLRIDPDLFVEAERSDPETTAEGIAYSYVTLLRRGDC